MKNKNSKAPETKEYIDLSNLTVRPIRIDEENTWNSLMSKYHYLGFNSLVGESIKYVAEFNSKWVALMEKMVPGTHIFTY